MKKIDNKKHLQIESLINECKGNVFEFLVTQKLSRFWKSEDHFLLGLPKDFRHRFMFYEEAIRKFDPLLLGQLDLMAQKVVSEVVKLPLFKKGFQYHFNVIGKMVATNDNELWNETDIVISEIVNDEIQKRYFLSLKLTKDHSFTNTKSAGVKSFLEKYFKEIDPECSLSQRELNREVDESFLVMGHNLYRQVDLEFGGSFDSRWSDLYTELPGELPENLREIVHANYARVTKKLYELTLGLYHKNPQAFYESLFSLCGFGNPDIIQVSCFHQKGEFKSLEIKTHQDLFCNDVNELKFGKLSDNGSSFDLEFDKFSLQLRIKPMNKFTTAAYKVNCSIKAKVKKS